MKNNFPTEPPIEDVFMEMAKEAVEDRIRKLRFRVIALSCAAFIRLSGFALIAWFDWRLGVGVFLLMWAEGIRGKFT